MAESRNDKPNLPFRTYDKDAEQAVVYGDLPHWLQAGTLCFITWRTWDSIPQGALQRWLGKREQWLRKNGITAKAPSLRSPPSQLAPHLRKEYMRRSALGWNRLLDRGHGECVLRQPNLAQVVAETLHHAQGIKCDLYDFVVMPNHVHLIAAFPTIQAQLDVCRDWKHYTATELNKLLGRKGRFWQTESFDHLIRSEAQFHRFRRYIAQNPVLANLPTGQFLHYTKSLNL